MSEEYPSYLKLLETGELEERVDTLSERLKKCDLCPHECSVDRTAGEKGVCKAGELIDISSVCDHHGEEPAISGYRGSGTIFFCHCNLRCEFCQNYQISQSDDCDGRTRTTAQLAYEMLYLQNTLKVHNINVVSPTHYVAQILEGIYIAAQQGLKLPIVYNTNSYDNLDVIKMLDGVVDIYLPDLKYADNEIAKKYSGAPEYVEKSRAAIKEMHRQVGELVVDEKGVAIKGVIVRHLVLPSGLAGSEDSLRWLANEVSSTEIAVGIVSQYHPSNRACNYKKLNRRVSRSEYKAVMDIVEELDFEHGWVQGMPSWDFYLPDFESEGHPFEDK